MTIADISLNFVLNVTAGVVGILIVLWIERQRRPRLTIDCAEKTSLPQPDNLNRPAASWLHVVVVSSPMPKWLKWAYRREPAFDCRAFISYFRENGSRLQEKEMPGRWAGSPEPKFAVFQKSKDQAILYPIFEPFSMTISENQPEILAVALRLSSDEKCYGFYDGSYQFMQESDFWRDPKWELGKGVFVVKVRILSGGREFSDGFRIINDVSYGDFRLEPLTDTKVRGKIGLG